MNKLLMIGFLILLSGCALATELMDTEAPIRKPYEQIKYNYIMKCGHWQPAAECRKKALDICEDNNLIFQKLEVHGTNCFTLVREEPKDYVHCANSLKIHCTGREDL